MQDANVLFVFADQWTFWALGCHGNEELRTPRIDRFATESVDCVNAISSCPVCSPARASLLTGLRPDRHGLFINDVPLNPELPSFGKHFQAAGYDTAYVGKWHVDGHGRRSYIPKERRHGFDYFQALECTHDYQDSCYYANDDPAPRVWDGYDAFAQTEKMIHWLHNREDDHRPFCAVLSWGPPHNPYQTAPESFKAHYHPDKLTPRANVPEDRREVSQRDLAGYYAHCEALDTAFGQLLDAIDQLGCRDNTVVVFTSDHGDLLQSHSLAEKQGPWDESFRIPFLIRAPWMLPAGSVNRTFFEFHDSWPTIASLCELPVTTEIQGRDLSTYLAKETVPEENIGFYASYVPFGNWPRQKRATELTRAREARGVRTERYLYVESLEGPWLLYDCMEDPLQMTNRADDPELEPVQRHLASHLRKKLAEQADEFLPADAYIKKWGYEVDELYTKAFKD